MVYEVSDLGTIQVLITKCLHPGVRVTTYCIEGVKALVLVPRVAMHCAGTQRRSEREREREREREEKEKGSTVLSVHVTRLTHNG
jgi:hypothetical protein